ncbi:MAG TPA: hypothetical protein VG733_19655 [Chthoniobacteraceae bacterium]|nr:hypothetical protein [Chthoniobacteraceae bacterium]
MAIDFNEARATIDEAKKRGLIRGSDSTGPVPSEASPKPQSQEKASGVVMPDWLLGNEEMPRQKKRHTGI